MSMAWSIPSQEKMKYDHIFDGLHPVNGFLSGDKVKPILLNSKLPVEVLGKVWELSDIDSDGFLDRDEFTVAMHLVYRALEKIPVPNQLPPEMVPISKRNLPVQVLPPHPPQMQGYAPHLPPMPAVPQRVPSVTIPGAARIVITPVERASYDEMFTKYDTDEDGFLSGIDVKDILLQSGLPQMMLAHIWNLCDTASSGKLNRDQFALAMYLIQQKLKGVELPMFLSPDMLPPSIKLPSAEVAQSSAIVLLDQSSVKELDELSKEIDELKKEKMKLEQEKAQREADIHIQEGEINNLQKDLDGFVFTVKQLESQKLEAQKKLDELDDQKAKLQSSVAEYKEKYEIDQKQIQELRNQINNKNAQNKESEMKRLREEITEIERQEAELKMRYSDEINNEKKLNESLAQLEAYIAETSLDIADLKDKVEDATSDNFASNFQKAEASFGAFNSTVSAFSKPADQKFEVDPFQKPLDNSIAEDPFKNEDPFLSDDPFGSDPFNEAFGGEEANQQSFFPFPSSVDVQSNASDPWGGGATTFDSGLDCFDPFGTATAKKEFDDNDPFGTGSFLPTKTPSSTNLPVLPPKQKKTAVPPRPPAPKPNGGLTGGTPFNDPFDVRTSPFPATGWTPKKDSAPPKFRSEAEQLAWAKRDSQEEYEKLRKIREQEDEDLRLAIALSKQEMK